MSRTGLYWEDRAGQLCCAHGVILYGRSCANCERGDIPDTLTPHERANPRPFISEALRSVIAGQTAKFHDGGFVPKSMRATGFDTASGEDHVAYVKARVGDDGSFTVEEVLNGDAARAAINGDEAKMEAMQARMSAASHTLRDELLREASQGRGWGGPYAPRDEARKHWKHSQGDPRVRPEHYSCRSTIRPCWGDGTPMTEDEADLMNGRYRGAQIITDPNDTRGVNARRVGEHRA